MSTEQTPTRSEDTSRSPYNETGYATFDDVDGHVIEDAGPNSDELGYAWLAGNGARIDVSWAEIMFMAEAIKKSGLGEKVG